MRGLITKSTGSWYQLKDVETEIFYNARIRGKFKLLKSRLTNPLAVGDFVEFQLEDESLAWITEIEPRKNYLIRKSVNLSKEAHIIASNIDLACFIFTLKHPETSLGFLDRFLATTEAYNIPVLILMSKIDLLSEEEIRHVELIEAQYAKIGYQTLQISSYSGLNIDALMLALQDRVSVFFGHSGSGKSTLVNTLQEDLQIKTSELSTSYEKGKHTTTFAQMHFWDFGGSVIDTPGVREFAMIDFEKDQVQHYFPEIFELRSDCKFHNCLHVNEPKCKVLESLETGEVLESRYSTYLKLMDEVDEQSGK